MIKPVFSTSNNGYTLILGLGETGLAAAHWYLRQGLPVRLADTRLTYRAHIDALQELYKVASIEPVLGEAALAFNVLDSVQTIILSPGLAVTDEAVASLLVEAQKRDIKVISEIELFAQALVDLSYTGYDPKVLAITGTNGKTTVTQMLKHMVIEAEQSVVAAGNIGPAAVAALIQALDDNCLPDFWIIELSSFQLLHTYRLPVFAGVVLNLSQDHLDWHGSMQAYIEAKSRLFSMSQFVVFNRDDELTKELAVQYSAHQVRSFGLSPAPNTNDLGVAEHQGQSWIGTSVDSLLPVASLVIVGKHNLSNALAALTLAHVAGIDWRPAVTVLRSYYGEPHRCQLVRNIAGVDFINDSKGTNVGATVAAIEGLNRPLVLILGGVAKGQDFSPVAKALDGRICRAVILIGRDAPFIARALASTEIPVQFAADLNTAVHQSLELALRGDVVLLSPACASLDMFANYIERGEQFIEAVSDLALDRGEVV